MEIRVQSIHFDASQQLKALIEKKVNKLAHFNDGILSAEVALKVVKPETNNNKEITIKLSITGNDVIASRTDDTFEKAIDDVCEALQKQLIKAKEKTKN